MKKHVHNRKFIIATGVVAVVFAVVILLTGIHPSKPAEDMADGIIAAQAPSPAAPSPTPVPLTKATPDAKPESAHEPEPEPEPEPGPEFFVIAMMGDCTFASGHGEENLPNSFESVVGDDYAYPFSLTKHLFEDADFVIINFESVMSEHNVPINKWYNFNARLDYVNILHEAGIHMASLGNNHTEDYGSTGYRQTEEWLAANNIAFAPYNGKTLYTTERGLVIGVLTQRATQYEHIPRIESDIAQLRDDGAELIIFAAHHREEYKYRATREQIDVSRAAIDAGAHIVMGTHAHVIQPMEEYNGGIIYYGLGNWSFGGSFDVKDPDTILAKVTVMRGLDGTISVTGTDNIPCAISGDIYRNDYRPVPYEIDSPEYLRAMSKLDGTFDGPDIVIDWRPFPEYQQQYKP